MKLSLVKVIALSFIFTMLNGCLPAGSDSSGDSADSDSEATDTTPPSVQITSPVETSSIGLPEGIVVEGTASDDEALANVSLSINGADAQSVSVTDGEFSLNVALTKAANAIVVTATDFSGNTATAETSYNFIAEGVLQTKFGGDTNPVDTIPDGFLTRDAGSHDGGFGLVQAEDGSLFTTGFARTNGGSGDYDMVLWKITEAGAFDTNFGTDGMVFLDDPTSGSGNSGTTNDFSRELALDNSGRVIIVGISNDDLVVARFDQLDGSLDTSFGGDINPADGTPDGFIVLDQSGSGSADDGVAVTIDNSNNVYVAGKSDDDLYVWKFTSSGVLDTSFGSGNGFVTYDSGSTDAATDIDIDHNKKLVVLGRTNGSLFLWRMDLNGNDDDTFGTNGKVTQGSTYTVSKMTIDSDNSIVVTGSTTPGVAASEMTLWRFTNTGSLDNNFGSGNGFVSHPGVLSTEKDYGFDVVIDAAGNIVVSGTIYTDVSNKENMAVWRYSSVGLLDTEFASGGYFLHTGAAKPGGVSNLDRGFGLVIDTQGSLIISGDSQGTGGDLVVWKLK